MDSLTNSTSLPQTSTNAIAKEVKIYNEYVSESMKSENKIDTWIVVYKDIQYPVVAVACDSEFVSSCRSRAQQVGYQQFQSNQCAENCHNICHIFGKNDYILCRHSRLTTAFTTELSSIASDIYQNSLHDYKKFTISIATDQQLAKNKYTDTNNDELIHKYYAGNCDTISKDEFTNDTRMIQGALEKYWQPVYEMLDKLTKNWIQAGKRHAMLQRVQTIQDISHSVAQGKELFSKTLDWTLDVLRKIKKPITMYTMSDRVQLVIDTISNGRIDESDKESVILVEYHQMNDIIMLWLEKNISRSVLYNIMVDICKS